MNDRMELIFTSLSKNEAFARMVISAFLVPENPTLSVISEVRTAVSEAVTNAVVHAYADGEGKIILRAEIKDGKIFVEVEDFGKGIEDVEQAMRPFFTTRAEDERTGMGFAMMQSFMDELDVRSKPGEGTKVLMIKRLQESV